MDLPIGGTEIETQSPYMSSPVGTVTRARPSPLIETPPKPGSGNDMVAVPSGMDAASYAAGERAAYARAFAAALPSQQALGQLFQAVDTLHERLETDATTVRNLQEESTRTSAAISAVNYRIESIEANSLPNMQRRCDDLAARPALTPEVALALQHLRDTLTELSTAQQRCLEAAVGYAGKGGFFVQQLRSLVNTAAGYVGATLSKADVAAVFLSRKILLGDMKSLVGTGQQSAGDKAGTALGAGLFIALVEGAWQIQEHTAAKLPKALRPVNAPFRTGLRAVRTLVWSAAFVLAASELRDACRDVVGKIGQSNRESSNPQPPPHPPPVLELMAPTDSDIQPYSASLSRALADLESGRTPPKRPHSSGSAVPARELLRDNGLFEQPPKPEP